MKEEEKETGREDGYEEIKKALFSVFFFFFFGGGQPCWRFTHKQSVALNYQSDMKEISFSSGWHGEGDEKRQWSALIEGV